MSARMSSDAWLATEVGAPDARERLVAVDERLRQGPFAWGWYNDLVIMNRATAVVWEMLGEPALALAAVRRRPAFLGKRYLAASLREEGRLAAEVGDVEGAIYAYEYYLELRSDPEPALVPQAEEVRAALAALR